MRTLLAQMASPRYYSNGDDSKPSVAEVGATCPHSNYAHQEQGESVIAIKSESRNIEIGISFHLGRWRAPIDALESSTIRSLVPTLVPTKSCLNFSSTFSENILPAE